MQAEMYKIGSIGNGFLAIMALPSLQPEDPASILNISRLEIRLVVSLLEPGEARGLGLDAEREQAKAYAMEYLPFPIPDMGVPSSVEKFTLITRQLFQQISSGVNTLVHCHAGIGRSGLMAAGILLHCDLDPEQAFAHVSKMRGIKVPETNEQRDWLVINCATIVNATGEQ